MPRNCLTAGLAQDPFADFVDQPGFFGKWNKFARHHRAAIFGYPPHQRFQCNNFASIQIHLRLIDQREIAILDRCAQIGFHCRAAFHRNIHLRREKLIGILAERLAVEHRRVGVLEQRWRIAAIVGIQGNTDRARHMLIRPAHAIHRAQCLQHFLRHARSALMAFEPIEQHDKFVATLPRNRIVPTHRGGQSLRDLAQQFIADIVAE